MTTCIERAIFLYVCLRKVVSPMRYTFGTISLKQDTNDLVYYHYNALQNGNPTALKLAASDSKLRLTVRPDHIWAPELKVDRVEWKLAEFNGSEIPSERTDYDFSSGQFYLRIVGEDDHTPGNSLEVGLISGTMLVKFSAVRYLPEIATKYALQYLGSFYRYSSHKGSQAWGPQQTACTDLRHAKQICSSEAWCQGFSYDKTNVTGTGDYLRACMLFTDQYDLRNDAKYSANFVSYEKKEISPQTGPTTPLLTGEQMVPPGVAGFFAGLFVGLPLAIQGLAALGASGGGAAAIALVFGLFGPIVGIPGGINLKRKIDNDIVTRQIPDKQKRVLQKYLPALVNKGSKRLYKQLKENSMIKECGKPYLPALVKRESPCPDIRPPLAGQAGSKFQAKQIYVHVPAAIAFIDDI